jgi:two-component system chemotaxis response regulator CheB
MTVSRKIKVLVVDDSAIVRKILTEALEGEADLEVVGAAPDPYVARDKIVTLSPDVLTLDIEMPRMDGLTFLKKLMHYRPMPVIVISSLGQASAKAAIEALRLGAVEVLAKPGGPYSVGELRIAVASKIRAAAVARLRRPSPDRAAGSPSPAVVQHSIEPGEFSPNGIVAIGASTGGTEAIHDILVTLPKTAPPIVIAQHIPAGFSRAFADRLNSQCAVQVKEAQDGDAVLPGRVLIAPGDFHMLVRRGAAGYRVAVKTGPRVCYQRPSVDVLFGSAAEAAGDEAAGVLLTGMGSDGAQGLLKMRNAGAHTIAQDESTSVVFGMPREAIRIGAAAQVLPLDRIAEGMLGAVRKQVSALKG